MSYSHKATGTNHSPLALSPLSTENKPGMRRQKEVAETTIRKTSTGVKLRLSFLARQKQPQIYLKKPSEFPFLLP